MEQSRTVNAEYSIKRSSARAAANKTAHRRSVHGTGHADSRSASGRRAGRNASLVRFFLTLMVVASVVTIILFTNRNVTSADETGNEIHLNKYYKTITIENGATLWDIANEYKSGDYKSTQEYVDELMSMNGLHTDEITAGQKLIVAYFTES